MEAGGRLSLIARESIRNARGGIIRGEDIVATAVKGDLINQRSITTHQTTRDRNDFADPAARIEAGKRLELTAGRDLHNSGSHLQAGGDVVLLYRGLLATEPHLAGTAEALACLGVPLLAGEDLLETFAWFARKQGCSAAVDQMMARVADGDIPLAPLAYVAAWLSVAGGNSVLPPWVRHQLPQVAPLLHQLREYNCGQANCSYCCRHHDPQRFLRDFYGFADFRPEPATEEGTSLQEAIVRAAARGHTLFATLPTGGGKSLCYLLPALMRYQRRNLLTIIISPLQALMKDQVDNFSRCTGTKIAAAVGQPTPGQRPYTIAHAAGLQEAIQAAAGVAGPGDVVLLSPGGTSFDQFIDFEQRGQRYRQWLKDLS